MNAIQLPSGSKCKGCGVQVTGIHYCWTCLGKIIGGFTNIFRATSPEVPANLVTLLPKVFLDSIPRLVQDDIIEMAKCYKQGWS